MSLKQPIYQICLLLLGLHTLCGAWFFRYHPAPVPGLATNAPTSTKLVNLLLVPAGDARHQGRSIVHQFESSCMMALSQQLKNELETHYTAVRVLLSHGPGDIVQPWQVATMANTLDIDLVLSLHCYHEQGPKPTITLYNFSYGQDFVQKLVDLCWYEAHQAYLFAIHTTQAWISLCKNHLSGQPFAELFTVAGPFNVPFKPLIGIKVPAIGIEMSFKDDNGYQEMVNPIVQSLKQILEPLVKQATIQETS